MAQAEVVSSGYIKVNVPCLIVWGGRDETLPLAMGYMLADEIPGAQLRIVTEAMHCLPTERPLACTRLIRDFLAEKSRPDRTRIARVDQVGNALAAGTAAEPASVKSALNFGRPSAPSDRGRDAMERPSLPR